jgi:hypothetical protein
MLKERAHKLRVSSNLRRLFGNPWRYFLALLKRALCDASVMTWLRTNSPRLALFGRVRVPALRT